MKFRSNLSRRLRSVIGARHLLSYHGKRSRAISNAEGAVLSDPKAKDFWNSRLAIREPYVILHHWLSKAVEAEPQCKARTACLATVDAAGQPVTRMTIVEQINASGLTFYTSMGSRLAGEIQSNPHVSLQLHWPHIDRSVHIAGVVSPVSPVQAQLQFARYPREVQLSMHGILVERRSLFGKIGNFFSTLLSSQYMPKVPPPPNWGGFVLSPTLYEFFRCSLQKTPDFKQCMRFRRCLSLPRGKRYETVFADRYDWVYDSNISHDCN